MHYKAVDKYLARTGHSAVPIMATVRSSGADGIQRDEGEPVLRSILFIPFLVLHADFLSLVSRERCGNGNRMGRKVI